MKRIYGFYRPERIGTKNLGGNTSLNGNYTMSFYANGQYEDYIQAGLIKIFDGEISENKYTKEVVPGIKDLRRFIFMEYNDTYIDMILAKTIINRIGARFDLELFSTSDEAIAWIKKHTDLEEVEPGKFLLSEASKDINGKDIEAKYLIIN